MNSNLICPKCKGKLFEIENIHCNNCHKTFYKKNGIINFLDKDQQFNKGQYTTEQIKAWSFSSNERLKIRKSIILSLLNKLRIKFSLSGRRDRIFKKGFKKKGKILDIGCGGGRHYLANYGYVVGIDPVLPLLNQAKYLYNDVYMASCTELPFADSTFDYVCSSDVLGHIDPSDKEKLFKEMYRVLKPGGRAIHAIESESTNPWFLFAHSDPQLYDKVFIQKPGHIGMELPSFWKFRFLQAGFKQIKFETIGGLIQEPGNISSWFVDYKGKSKLIDSLCFVDKLLARNFVIKQLINFVLEPLFKIETKLTPIDYGNGVLVVFEK